MTIAGKTYHAKPVESLTVSEFARFVACCEKAASEPEQFFSALRGAILVVIPLAARDSRSWNDGDVLSAVGEVTAHMSAMLRTLGSANERFIEVGETLQSTLTAICKTREEIHG